MIGWRNVVHEKNVVAPRKRFRILSTTDYKSPGRLPSRGAHEQFVEGLLAILRECTQVREIRREFTPRLRGSVHGRIDAAVNGDRVAGPQTLLEVLQGFAASIAQHQIEVG